MQHAGSMGFRKEVTGPTGMISPTTARRIGLIVIALLPFFVAQGVRWPSGPPALMGDPYHYLLHARALVEGRAYTDIEYIYTETNGGHGPRAHPPGLPVLLAGVLKVFGPDSNAIPLMMVGLSALFLGLAGWWVARQSTPWMGVAVVWMMTGIVAFVRSAPFALSDVPLSLSVWAMICLLERKHLSTRRLAVIGVLSVLAASTRVLGVLAVVALGVYGLLRRDHRRVLLPVGAVGAVGAVALVGTFATQFNVWNFGPRLNIPYILTSWVQRVADYRGIGWEALLYPFPLGLMSDVYHVVASVLFVVGLVEWIRRTRVTYATVFVVVYVTAIVLAPIAATSRYLFPVVPIILFGLLNSFRMIMARFKLSGRWAPETGATAVAGVLALMALTLSLARPMQPSLRENPEVQQLVEYIRGREEPMRLVFIRPRFLGWETRQPGMPIPSVPSPIVVLDEFDEKGVTHVVTSGLTPELGLEDQLKRVVRLRPERFVREFQTGGLTLYRFVAGEA